MSLSWSFLFKSKYYKIGKIREKALRFIYKDYNSTYEELLHIAKVLPLQIRRLHTIALSRKVYKIV